MAEQIGDRVLSSARWALRLFGGFELTELASGERVASIGKRERVLLAYLAVAPNCRETRRKLATLLWGDATDETALDNLRTCIWSLRKALHDTEHRIIVSEGENISVGAAAFDIDVLTFRRLSGESNAKELDAAAQLYGGEFLSGIDIDNEEFESWRRGQASQCREAAIDVLNRLTTQFTKEGDTERAIKTGVKLLQLDPLHEPATRALMRLYAASGRRGAAIQLYRSLSEALKSELDAQPEVETRTVYAEIAKGSESSQTPSTESGAAAVLPPKFADANFDPPSSGGGLKVGPISKPGVERSAASTNVLRFPLPATVAAFVVVALLLFSYRELPLFRPADTINAERAAALSQASAVSIAVLPFDNMSGDANQEFFSDGVTEEITTALAKVPDLRVVARQSAYQFKGKKNDLRTVGKALGATHLIEGSVRKDGNRVRITAQVIRTDDGTHVWANAYDRELKDIFVVQEDIARAITGSLRMPLGLKQGQQLISNRGIDSASYEKYLSAKALIRDRLGDNAAQALGEAATLLEDVVATNPNFAPAWALLAYAYDYTPNASNPLYIAGPLDKNRAAIAAVLAKSDAAGSGAYSSIRPFHRLTWHRRWDKVSVAIMWLRKLSTRQHWRWIPMTPMH